MRVRQEYPTPALIATVRAGGKLTQDMSILLSSSYDRTIALYDAHISPIFAGRNEYQSRAVPCPTFRLPVAHRSTTMESKRKLGCLTGLVGQASARLHRIFYVLRDVYHARHSTSVKPRNCAPTRENSRSCLLYYVHLGGNPTMWRLDAPYRPAHPHASTVPRGVTALRSPEAPHFP